MVPYVFLLVVLVVALFFERVTRSYDRGGSAHRIGAVAVSVFCSLVLLGFAGFRYGIGTDYRQYLERFLHVSPLYGFDQGQESYQEPGYIALSLLARYLSNSDLSIFWIMSGITLVFTFVAIRRSSADPVLSIYLYVTLAFYLSSFNTVRQAAAVAILFYGTIRYRENKAIFVGAALGAASLHASSLIAAASILLALRWKPTRATVTALVVLTAAVAIGFAELTSLGSLVALLNPRYENYLGYQGAGLGTYMVLVIRVALLIFAYRKRKEEDQPLLALVTVGVTLLAIGTQSIPLARMELYFSIFMIVLLPNQLARRRNRNIESGAVALRSTGTGELAIVAVGAVYFFAYILNYGGIYPYTSWLGS